MRRKEKKKRAWVIWTTNPTECVFSVQRQLPFSSLIKHFEEMERQGKCGPKSDFLCWFYCFIVNKTCNSCHCEWASLLYAVKCCFICLYPVVPNLDVLRVTGYKSSPCSCHAVLCFTRVCCPCTVLCSCAGSRARGQARALPELGIAGNVGIQPLWESTSCSYAKGCLLPQWPV